MVVVDFDTHSFASARNIVVPVVTGIAAASVEVLFATFVAESSPATAHHVVAPVTTKNVHLTAWALPSTFLFEIGEKQSIVLGAVVDGLYVGYFWATRMPHKAHEIPLIYGLATGGARFGFGDPAGKARSAEPVTTRERNGLGLFFETNRTFSHGGYCCTMVLLFIVVVVAAHYVYGFQKGKK